MKVLFLGLLHFKISKAYRTWAWWEWVGVSSNNRNQELSSPYDREKMINVVRCQAKNW